MGPAGQAGPKPGDDSNNSIICFWMLMIQRAFWFLNQLPGVCSRGEGTPPETLKCLTPNPYS